jgi:hypothetical protein
MDITVLVNLILCVVIVIFGIIGYKKSNETWPLFLAISFGLFGISHLCTLLGIAANLKTLLIIIRTLAYLLVVFILYRVAFKK